MKPGTLARTDIPLAKGTSSRMMARVKIRLAGGVVASGLCAWVDRAPGPRLLSHESEAPPGAAVALGPAGAVGEQVRRAVAELTRLVEAGGVVAAGAGVDLGSGFRSGRLVGARGDQRDAVLAALRVLGVENADRLGERAGFLVALFGPAVTRRVGAAAARAIDEGRWAALHLAAAASDVLGPEQLERILALEAPEGADVISGGPPSVLGRQLMQVLGPMPGPRRLELIVDLWARVLEHHAGLGRRDRRSATQSRRSRIGDLRMRRRHHDDEHVLRLLRAAFYGREPSPADAARWVPPERYWSGLLEDVLHDALAVTVLLRTATAVADHGIEEGLERSATLLRTADAVLPLEVTVWSARRVPGLTGLPARPAAYVRDVHRRLTDGKPRDARFEAYIRPRLACARDFALVIMETVERLIDDFVDVRDQLLRDWAASDLRRWREGVGHSAIRPPAEWGGIPPWSTPLLGDREPLRRRLAASPHPDAMTEEVVGDLLWYADMVDALAQLYGHDAAQATPGTGAPWLDPDPPAPETDPLSPRLDSITSAVSGAAQLVALGAVPPSGVKTWPALTEGLLTGAAITAALTGEFAVPAPLAAVDRTLVPGTGTRLEVARNARVLAGWSSYMGNCIAGEHYIEDARVGRRVLVGLRDEDGFLQVNAELGRLRPAARGWRVTEIAARFNGTPDQALEQRFREWVAGLPGSDTTPTEADGAVPDGVAPGRPVRRRTAPRLVEDAGPALGTLARQAWEEIDDEVLETFAVLAETPPTAALSRLRRLGTGQLADACRRALGSGTVDLARLWTVTGVRPLRNAVQALDPALRERFDQLALLSGEPPLPRSLHRLVGLPAIVDAYALDLVTLRTRVAIGRLARADDPVLARDVTGHATEPLLCALTVMITSCAPAIDLTVVAPPGAVTVPGFPATSLDEEDGPWQRAFPAAAELGARTEVFGQEITDHGLRLPTSWLAQGGWPALWSRAHSRPALTSAVRWGG